MRKQNSASLPMGFTLIELLVVISVIALLASVILVSLNSSRQKARMVRTAADLKQIVTMLNLYLADNGQYPCFDHDITSDEAEQIWSATYGNWPKPMVSPLGYATPPNFSWDHVGGSTPYRIVIYPMPSLAEFAALTRIMGPYFLQKRVFPANLV